MELENLLKTMVEAKASDIFIIAGLPLAYEISGRQVRLDDEPFSPTDTEAFVRAIYEAAGRDIGPFSENGNHDDDFSFAIPGVGRFRANIFRQRGSFGAVIRVIPFGLPDPADYHIPEEVLRCAQFQKALCSSPDLRAQASRPRSLASSTGLTTIGRAISSRWKTRSNTCTSTEAAS